MSEGRHRVSQAMHTCVQLEEAGQARGRLALTTQGLQQGMRKFQKRAYLLAVQVRGDGTGCRSPPCHSQGSSSADSAGCGPPLKAQGSGSLALRHPPQRQWHLSQGYPTHHRDQGLAAISTPTLRASSAPQAGSHWQMWVCSRDKDKAFCPSSSTKGSENRGQ